MIGRPVRPVTSAGGSVRLGVIFAPEESSALEVIDGIYTAAIHADYSVVLSALTPARDPETALKKIVTHPCQALIVVEAAVARESLQRVGGHLPVVSVVGDTANDTFSGDLVHPAWDVGVELAVEHLFELGHRDIAYIRGRMTPTANSREAGYLRATTRLGLASRAITTQDGDAKDSGACAADMLLAQKERPTAVVVGDNLAAARLVHALLRAGIEVPQGVAVAGVEDNCGIQLAYLDVTAVRPDWFAMGGLAVQLAVERTTETRSPTDVVLAPRLIVRGSTESPIEA